jgi:hypothetical protein
MSALLSKADVAADVDDCLLCAKRRHCRIIDWAAAAW